MHECKELTHHQVVWDYDGVLYTECCSCWEKRNVHTWIVFSEWRQISNYSPLYQYSDDGKLVWYSRWKAEGLTIDDDLLEWKHLLWWTRGEDCKTELVFRPIKDLSIPHIKAILREQQTKRKDYIEAMTTILTDVIPYEKNGQ